MRNFMMTWNPVHWSWKELDDQIKQLQTEGSVERKWSCGNRKDLPVGSRVFLFKQGEGSRGIIGTGVTLSNPKDEPHFNPDRAKKGLTAKRVNVRWEILNQEPIIHLDQLKQKPFPDQNWVFQSSGEEIRNNELSILILSELQKFSIKNQIVSEHSANDFSSQPDFNDLPPSVDIEEPSQPERVLQKTNRIIRNTSIAQAVKEFNDFQCQICGESLNLGNGKYYAESHHIMPLGAPYNGPDVQENIICVCPNHHALLDYGAIRLDQTDFERIHEKFIKYHNENIYQKVIT